MLQPPVTLPPSVSKGLPFGQDLLNGSAIRHNATVLSFNRVFASLLAGLVAGVWGITGWSGFAYYFIAHLLLTIPLYFKANFAPQRYFQSNKALWMDNVVDSTSVLTFILFWTLSNNFVHLF
eukprot:jgi/Astpho2/6741/Aster-x1398